MWSLLRAGLFCQCLNTMSFSLSRITGIWDHEVPRMLTLRHCFNNSSSLHCCLDVPLYASSSRYSSTSSSSCAGKPVDCICSKTMGQYLSASPWCICLCSGIEASAKKTRIPTIKTSYRTQTHDICPAYTQPLLLLPLTC